MVDYFGHVGVWEKWIKNSMVNGVRLSYMIWYKLWEHGGFIYDYLYTQQCTIGSTNLIYKKRKGKRKREIFDRGYRCTLFYSILSHSPLLFSTKWNSITLMVRITRRTSF
ncbi:hypothetical protein ACMFMG_004503 [Clarireedia jacksonii]